MDMISKLPEIAQHNILNFLEEDDVCRASVLSKAWRSLVESRPVISFRQSMQQKSKNAHDISTNFIDESLRKKVYVERFSLVLVRYDNNDRRSHWDKNMDSWFEYLVNVGVKEVKLVTGLRYYPNSLAYTLPPSLLRSKTLTKLWLEPCDMKYCNASVDMPNLLDLILVGVRHDVLRVFKSGCPNLLRLNLKSIFFERVVFEEFLSETPNLEVLALDVGCSRVLDIFCVLGLGKLRVVRLNGGGFGKVQIVAPKLREVNIIGSGVTEIDLLACESTLKVLNLCRLEQVSEETLRSILYKFLELEELVLEGLRVKSIEIANEKIRKLEITSCGCLENIKIDAPNLRVFFYKDNNIPFSTMRSTSSLEKFESQLDIMPKFRDKFSSWLHSFKELFLSMKRGFKDMKLILLLGKIAIVCEELNENVMKMIRDMNVNGQNLWKLMCIVKHECMPDELFRNHNIAYVYWVSRDQGSYEKFLKVAKNKILKENEEPKPKRYKNMQSIPRNHFLSNVELIRGETAETPKIFKPYDATDYEITCIKLYYTNWYW